MHTFQSLKRAVASSGIDALAELDDVDISFNPSSGRWPLQAWIMIALAKPNNLLFQSLKRAVASSGRCAGSVAWKARKGKHFREVHFWRTFLLRVFE